jgi:hypothetical protein
MALVLIVLAAAAVFVIAAVVIGREARRLDDQAPRPVFDMDEAVTWVAERLPFEVAARLSHDDVRTILERSLQHLPIGGQDRMVADDEMVAQVQAAGGDWTDAEVWAVVDLESTYLEAIGAIGFPPPERGGGPTAESL